MEIAFPVSTSKRFQYTVEFNGPCATEEKLSGDLAKGRVEAHILQIEAVKVTMQYGLPCPIFFFFFLGDPMSDGWILLLFSPA